jgi:large subunit ribosomal protein L35
MPKQKTRKAAAKRFKKTGTGKLKRNCAGTGHLFTCKSSKQKRRLRSGGLVSTPELKRITELMPK